MRGSAPANLFRAGACPMQHQQVETDWLHLLHRSSINVRVSAGMLDDFRPHFWRFLDAGQHHGAGGDRTPIHCPVAHYSQLSTTKGYLRHPLQFAAVFLITRRQHYAPTRQPLNGTSCGTWWSPCGDDQHVLLIRRLPKFARPKLAVISTWLGRGVIRTLNSQQSSVPATCTGQDVQQRTTTARSNNANTRCADKARRLVEKSLVGRF